jgi:uncharacterized protein
VNDVAPKTSRGIRDRVGAFLGGRVVFAVVAAAMLLLTAIHNAAPLFGFGVVIATLWAGRWDMTFFGLSRLRLRDLLRASKYTVVVLLAVDAVAQPALERWFGVPPADLSMLQFLNGNLRNLILFLGFMWVVAAVGEEMVFRGYLMKGWARCLGDSDRNWLLGAVFTSVVFGLAHAYQGLSGVLSTALGESSRLSSTAGGIAWGRAC